ncbi:hypothetical protein OEZ85_013410 [Tetradesmus obliquus]|uniref:JmjC domain-containing protein n=1 Tax=Tetradesmus obliquus TaxID=3088 RepID=A0ABY8U6M4_TETOB|nr:hypothetical protein OEZ85_013410 [Tetradesmus obliquus]
MTRKDSQAAQERPAEEPQGKPSRKGKKHKKQQQQQQQEAEQQPEQQGQEQPHGHPYGVQPWGNFYLTGVPEIRTAGLGLLSPLPDELLLDLLFNLPAADLARLGLASKALYCFAHTSELWKALAIQELEGDFAWCGSWRETYLQHKARGYVAHSHRPLAVQGFYSDFLHQPWFCANVEIQLRWLEVDNIERRAGLTPEQFRAQYEAANRPVVLTDAMDDWPALTKWSRQYLTAALAGRPVIVGNMPWRFSAYMAYCDSGAAQDEMPLYLFDKAFAAASPQLAGDYRVPAVFSEDLFEVLGEEGRPDYRWLIVGPARSGSSFHVDPNATCAWNACVSGRKKWIMFPPGTPPPGVYPSPDGADVAAPISLFEWLLNFYEEARESKHHPLETISGPGELLYVPRGWWHMVLNLDEAAAANIIHPPLETITGPGELLYVPRGWWHMVLNLDEAVAVTQNFVSSVGLPAVLAFLKQGSEGLVSGCCLQDRSSLHDRFVAALQQRRPQVLAALAAKQAAAAQQREAEHRLCQLFKQPGQQQQQGAAALPDQPAAAAAAAAAAGGSNGFCFGFQVAGSEPAVEQQAGAAAAAGGGFSFGFDIPAAAEGGEGQGQQDSAAAEAAGSEAEQQQQQQQQQGGKGKGKRGRQHKSEVTEEEAVCAAAAAAAGEVAKKQKHAGGKRRH